MTLEAALPTIPTIRVGNTTLGHLSQADRQAHARTIYDMVRTDGYSHTVACYGFLASAQGESSFDTAAVGDHGRAVNLWQWHPDRAAIIKDKLGVDVADPACTVEQATRAVLWEMRNSEIKAGTALRAYTGTDGPTACGIFVRMFERSGNPDADVLKRTGFGDSWNAFFTFPLGQAPGATAAPAPPAIASPAALAPSPIMAFVNKVVGWLFPKR